MEALDFTLQPVQVTVIDQHIMGMAQVQLRVVADARTLKSSQDLFGGNMPASCLYAAQPFVQKRPDQVQALVHAMVHTLKWLQTAEPADIVKALPAAYLAGDRALYLAAFYRMRETFSPNGVMPDDGPAVALRTRLSGCR